MSVEEDTELRDLVSQTLENNGVLAKIRAELRASVFLALEEQDSSQARTPFVNRALREYLGSPDGALGLCLIREFLEYLELDFTLSVFNSETCHGKGYEYSGRSKLIKDLRIKNLNGKKGPLLAHVLQIAQQASDMTPLSADVKEEELQNTVNNIKSSPGDKSHLNDTSETLENHINSPNTSGILNQTFVTEGSTVKGLGDVDSKLKQSHVKSQGQPQSSLTKPQQRLQQNQISNENHVSAAGKLVCSPDEVKSDSSTEPKDSALTKGLEANTIAQGNGETSNKDSKGTRWQNVEKQPSSKRTSDKSSPLTTLNDLPPLDGFHEVKGSRFNRVPSITDPEPPDNYEEDFLSTDSSATVEDNSMSHSHRTSNKVGKAKVEIFSHMYSRNENAEKEASDKGTNSPISEEIDEDTNSGIDDFLTSTASGDNTVDATVSLVNQNFADFVESV